jgi:hypothetical protein
MEKVIETRVFRTWVSKEGILCTEVKDGAEITIEDAWENTEAVYKLVSPDSSLPILVNLKNIKSISKEARDYFSLRNRNSAVNAMGLLIKSPLSTIIGNFFIGLNKPVVPTKLFYTEKKAISWLLKYVED